MPNREPIETTNLDTIYGSQAIPWSRPRDLLAAGAFGAGTACFLGTVRPDGRPHPAGIGAACYDGDGTVAWPGARRNGPRYRFCLKAAACAAPKLPNEPFQPCAARQMKETGDDQRALRDRSPHASAPSLSRVSASRMPIGKIARCSITARWAMLAAISGY